MTRTFRNHVVSFSLVVAGLMLAGGPVVAEENEPSRARYEFTSPAAFHQPVAPLPAELGFAQDHSSTAAEGFLRGKAAVIHAIGNLQLAESQSAILFEQARSLDRENDLKQTQALHAQQLLWREAREEKRAAFEARLAQGRAKLATRRATVHRAAYQLSPAELNVVTSEIQWPATLEADKFRADRERMQELFRQLVSYGEAQPSVAAEIARVSEALARAVRSDIRTLSPNEYLAAQKFLLGLKLAAGDVQG